MRLLRINSKDVEIDDKTAIGITYQSYDLKSPAVRKVNISNSFNIPATYNNLAIFGNANDPQSISDEIYKSASCDYWIGNEHIVKDSRIRVESISDRIELFIFQKPDVWDLIKLVNWTDFVGDFVKWMQEERGLYSRNNKYTGSFSDFIDIYADATEGIKLPFFFGNLYNYDPDEGLNYLEDPNSIYLRYFPAGSVKADGGHLCVYCKTIFQYIEYKYNVDFLTGGDQKVGNIWNDPIANGLYIPIRDVVVRTDGGYYFEQDKDINFLPLGDQQDKAGKKLYDFVNAFFQHLDIIKDEFEPNIIRLARFDDIDTKADIVDWSGLLSGQIKYKPYIDGYAVSNVIKFSDVYEEGDELVNSKNIICNNLNLDASTDLFTIDSYVCSFLNITGGVVPNMSSKESFKTFTFFLDAGLTDDEINIYNIEGSQIDGTTKRLQKAALYSLDSEYNFLGEILTNPKYYEIEKWLTINDVKELEFFKQYFIRELNGSFFINKISGFNPDKSNTPTKIELIKIGNKTPVTPPDLNYWVDGVGSPFVDGTGDYFF